MVTASAVMGAEGEVKGARAAAPSRVSIAANIGASAAGTRAAAVRAVMELMAATGTRSRAGRARTTLSSIRGVSR